MSVEFVKCPTCGDEVSTRYEPVSCYKCGPITVDPKLLSADRLFSGESISFWEPPAVLLYSSFLIVFVYQIATRLHSSVVVVATLESIGAMIVCIPLMLIGYFIARAVTKSSGKWHLVYIGILIASWIIARRF